MSARWFVRGDLDGFFGLALDNLVQLLLIDALCRFVLGFPAELVHGTILPAAAISILFGNAYYAWQAMKLAQRTGRHDVCALPYGINTVSLFAHVFLVMLPAKFMAPEGVDPARFAFQAGLVACIGSGLIEFGGAFVAERVRRFTPRAAMLSTLAGIALTFISLGFLFRTFARPIVGLVPLGVVLLTYFGGVRFKGGIPGGLVAVGLGTALGWATGIAPMGDIPSGLGLHVPLPLFGDLLQGLTAGHLVMWFSIILPMGLFNVVGSLQNIESAEAAGDSYETAPSLAVNGIGTVVAGVLGSCFPTTIYIGHPGWKALGARIGYSWVNGVVMAALCLSGGLGWLVWAVPIDAGMAIVLWIGIVIAAQAFQATPQAHAPAVVVGLLPGIAAWGALMIKAGVRAVEGGFDADLITALERADVWVEGAFALEQGFIFSAMILASAVVYIIERDFRRAALWCGVGAVLSYVGLMHSWQFTPAPPAAAVDTAMNLSFGAASEMALGYAAIALLLLVAPFVTEEIDAHHTEPPKQVAE